MAYIIDSHCTKCSACVEECPTNAITASDPIFLIDGDACIDCMACVPICPAEAIKKAPKL
jgi:ferredoxin